MSDQCGRGKKIKDFILESREGWSLHSPIKINWSISVYTCQTVSSMSTKINYFITVLQP